jgi:ribonuclease E
MSAPIQSVAPSAPMASASVPHGMPKVQSYTLPLESLQTIAQSSGLQWVNSDAARVAAVQTAIAAEPPAAHVPRERPAPVAMSDAPLILVETKKDLRNMTLPFEETSTT